MVRREGWMVVLMVGAMACGSDGEKARDEGDASPQGPDGSAGGDGDQGDGDDGPGGDGDAGHDTPGDGDQGDGDQGDGLVTREQLLGKWQSGCRADAPNYYGQNDLEFTSTKFTNRYRQYLGDPTCSDASKQVVDSMSVDSSWTLGGLTPQGFTESDAVNERRDVTLLDANTANAWSAGSGCGPFTANETKDVSGMTCYGYKYVEAGQTYYGVLSILDGVLRAGEVRGADITSPDARPTTLDLGEGRTYTRVP